MSRGGLPSPFCAGRTGFVVKEKTACDRSLAEKIELSGLAVWEGKGLAETNPASWCKTEV